MRLGFELYFIPFTWNFIIFEIMKFYGIEKNKRRFIKKLTLLQFNGFIYTVEMN